MQKKEKAQIIEYNSAIHDKFIAAIAPIYHFFEDFSLGYMRHYKDNSRLILESRPKWLEPYFDTELLDEVLNFNLCQASSSEKKEHVYITTGQPSTPVHSILHEFNLWNCVSLHYETSEYLEAFHFETSAKNYEIINLYAARPDILRHLTVYIREKLSFLDLDIAPRLYSNALKEGACLNDLNKRFEQLLYNTVAQKIYLPDQNTYLSRREAQCIYLFSSGCTFKQIGQELGISPRTAESYIVAVKSKLNIKFKSDFIVGNIGYFLQNHHLIKNN